MKDGILANTKNSRLLKASLPESYADFKALVEGGGLPLDLLFNASGWATAPTPLSKANLLSDATAAALGLSGSNPTVSEAFLSLTVGKVRLVTGSYVGTGTGGSAAPTSLSFDSPAALVIVGSSARDSTYSKDPLVLIAGASYVPATNSNYDLTATWNAARTKVSWYRASGSGTAADAGAQHNTEGEIYRYVAFLGNVTI